MTKKRKHALALIAVTVIWMACIELIAYAGFLGYRDVRQTIDVLKIQREDAQDRLALTRTELGACYENADRVTHRLKLAEFLLKFPPSSPETK